MNDATPVRPSAIPGSGLLAGLAAGPATLDRIAWVKLSLILLPLKTPISDAKVLTGRQKPLTEVAMLFAEIESERGHQGIGFSYSKRAGGYGLYAHAKEIAGNLIGEDPSDIARIWDKLVWAGASVGRSGLATQAIAAFDVALWDMKAKRAGLPLAKLLGARRDSVQLLQHLGRVPVDAGRPAGRQLRERDRGRHRRDQDQGRLSPTR